MRNVVLWAALVGVLSTGCSKKDEAGGAETTDAITAANAWLALVDGGKHGESWDQACEYFRNAVPKDQWVQQVSGVRTPLGRVLSRELDSAEYTTRLPGAPDGEYVVIQYKTVFENKASSVETVTPMRDPDGTFRVSGYYIR